jgi:hypothetical protein
MGNNFQILGHVMDDPRVVLRLKCNACRHEAVWRRDRALRAFGSGATPGEVRKRIKCGACGERRRVDAWV